MSPPSFQKTSKVGIIHQETNTNPKKVPSSSRNFTREKEGETVVSYFPQEDGNSISLRRLNCYTNVNRNALQDTNDQH